MGLMGIAADYRAGKYRGGTKTVSISTINESADPKTSLNCFSPGIEINPANGENLVFVRIKGSSSFLVTIGGINQNIAPDTDRGERRIYSVSADGETIKAKAKFKNDGTLELNGASSFAVKFEELQTALNALVVAINTNLALKLDGGGTAGTTSISLTPAKSADVKLS